MTFDEGIEQLVGVIVQREGELIASRKATVGGAKLFFVTNSCWSLPDSHGAKLPAPRRAWTSFSGIRPPRAERPNWPTRCAVQNLRRATRQTSTTSQFYCQRRERSGTPQPTQTVLRANAGSAASRVRARDERVSGAERNAPTNPDSAACQRRERSDQKRRGKQIRRGRRGPSLRVDRRLPRWRRLACMQAPSDRRSERSGPCR